MTSPKKKIVITEFMDEAAVNALRVEFEVVYDPALVDDQERLLAQVAEASAVIVRNRTQIRGALLAACAKATVIGRLGVGLDNIDVPACEARGMRVIPASGANALAVAEYVIGTAMALLREISGKRLGLIGFGGIGRLTAKLAQGLGMTVMAHDPMLPPDSPVWRDTDVQCSTLEALIETADVVSLHVPLTASTTDMLSAANVARMKRGAVLINTSRGGIANEAAVAAAVRSGHLGGAAFDVFEPEPLGPDNVWKECRNIILTPHVAGVTAESNVRVSTLIAAEVARYLKT